MIGREYVQKIQNRRTNIKVILPKSICFFTKLIESKYVYKWYSSSSVLGDLFKRRLSDGKVWQALWRVGQPIASTWTAKRGSKLEHVLPTCWMDEGLTCPHFGSSSPPQQPKCLRGHRRTWDKLRLSGAGCVQRGPLVTSFPVKPEALEPARN